MKTTWKNLVAQLGCAALLWHTAGLIAVQALSFEKFDDVKYIKAGEKKKAQEMDAALEINRESGELQVMLKKGEAIKINKTQVTGLIYERASKPRYAAGLLLAWPLLFTKSKKHFLTIQYKNGDKGEFALLHLDKNNYQPILAAAEAATGVKVEKMID